MEQKNQLPATNSGNQLTADNSIALNQTDLLDLSGLSSTQIAELKRQYAGGMIDVGRKAQEMKVDVAALEATLHSITDQTAKATQAGSHITTTHTQTTSIGRTETVIGNTDRAASGKLSRSAVGQGDPTLIYVIVGAAVAIVIAVLALG